MSSYISIYSLTPIWGSSPPLYLYIVTYPYRPHGSVDVQYPPMTILDHLFRGDGIPYTYIPPVVTYPPPPTHKGKGAAGIITTFLHAHNVSSNIDIAIPTHPQGGAGIISSPGPVDGYPLRGMGETGRAASYIYKIIICICICIYICVCK